MKRYDSIDVMRTLAICCLIPCHFLLFLSTYEPYPELYIFGNEILGGLGAGCFLFLVGLSQAVSLSQSGSTNRVFDDKGLRMIKRGALLFIIGILFQIPLEGAPYEWDALPFIGAAIVILCLLRKAPLWLLFLCACGAYFVAPWLRGLVGYLNYWEPFLSSSVFAEGSYELLSDPLIEYAYGLDPTFPSLFVGFFVTGYFPFFPWIMFPLFGYLVGQVVFTRKMNWRLDMPMAVLGVALICGGLAMAFHAQYYGSENFESGFVTVLTFFPPSPSWLMVQLGNCLVLLTFCRRLFDTKITEWAFVKYCRVIGKYSLTIYVIHYFMAYWPPRLMGIIKKDELAYFGNLMNPLTTWLVSILVLIGFYYVLSRWDRAKGKYSLEWLMMRMVPKRA